MLKKNFILVLQMRQEDRLRSRAVLAPANASGHAALMVKIRPNDLFGSAVRPQHFSGEILFLLDRSNSMGWTEEGDSDLKIDAMRAAMSLALSGLPHTCVFNIVSFGSEVRGMWSESRPAGDPANVKHAKAHLPYIKADMGGTEVLMAPQASVERSLPSHKSTQVILITDGEVESEPRDPILQFVWETRRRLGDKIRFFTLGIGDRVSHRIVESIAELGGGYCDIVDVVKRPRWQGWLNRMLRSVMEPDSWSCEIGLGPGYENQNLLNFRFGSDRLRDPSLVPVVQAPHPVPPLHPYSYKSIFFLLDLRAGEPPQTVSLQTTEGAKKKTFTLRVETANLSSGTLHHLATKAALVDLEDQTKREGVETDISRSNAESLGAQYSITRKCTSFVAVAKDRVS